MCPSNVHGERGNAMIVIRAIAPAKPGRWEAAKSAAAALRADAQTKPGVLLYNFAADEDHQTLVVTEGYSDSDALIAHIHGSDFSAFGAAVDVTRIEVHGKLGPEAEDLISAWGPVTALPWV
jgi:quinol monooxygenase YgiN